MQIFAVRMVRLVDVCIGLADSKSQEVAREKMWNN